MTWNQISKLHVSKCPKKFEVINGTTRNYFPEGYEFWTGSTSTSIFPCYRNRESFSHTCSSCSSGKIEKNNAMAWPCLWRTLLDILTFHWHGFTGLLLLISASTVQIKLWLARNSPLPWLCGLALDPLWSKITPECIWDMKPYQMYKLTKPVDALYSLSSSPAVTARNTGRLLSVTQQAWLTRIFHKSLSQYVM